MDSPSKILFLASFMQKDEGYWLIGVRNSVENILSDQNLLDCHRKELIGNESAKDIISAIESMEKKTISTHEYAEYEDRYQPIAALALFCFLMAFITSTKNIGKE